MHQGIGVGFSTLSEAETELDTAYAAAAPAPASGPRTAGRAARDAAEATRVRTLAHMALLRDDGDAALIAKLRAGCGGVLPKSPHAPTGELN